MVQMVHETRRPNLQAICRLLSRGLPLWAVEPTPELADTMCCRLVNETVLPVMMADPQAREWLWKLIKLLNDNDNFALLMALSVDRDSGLFDHLGQEVLDYVDSLMEALA